jgi:phenylalanyl-tRNA synthetase beta chain
MKISFNWLKNFIQINESPEEIGALLTKSGLEVEGIETFETLPGGLKGLVIGEVLTCERHPGADKLSKTTVDLGNGIIAPIVCGAPNVAAGQKVVVATVGTTVYPLTGEPFKISKAKIRGEVSEGMICAEDEIGLGESHDGILVLDTSLPNGTPAAEYFKIETDHVIEIGLTPNRADATSHLGVARDLKALLKKDICNKDLSSFKSDNHKAPININIENTAACPRYAGLTISGIKVQPSPAWLQNRLKAIGLSPINNIVDATNYVLHDLGQPLHAFDLNKVKGNTINVKTVSEGTSFVTLDQVERKLKSNDLMICNAEEPMCIAGVFGGANSGVSDATTAIFLESAYFSPDYIRKTAMQHGLKTDASFRFERGTDPNMPVIALKQAALLIKEIAGGEISSELYDIYSSPIDNFQFDVTYSNIDRLIGKKIEHHIIKEIVQSVGITITAETPEGLSLSVPPYKVDVQREVDVIEEIIRIYGFENIEVSEYLNSDFLANFPEKDSEKIKRSIANLLTDNGFNEILSNSLTSPNYYEGLTDFDPTQHVAILNRLSEDLGIMRRTLLFSGLEALAYNINRKQNNLSVYEFGKSYHLIEGKYKENNHLALWKSGNATDETWLSKSTATSFHDFAATITQLIQKLNLSKISIDKFADDVFKNGLKYTRNNKVIITAGILQKSILKKTGIKQDVYYADIDLDAVLKGFDNKIIFSEISKFPEVRRDLALVLDKKVSFDEISKLANKTERKLLKDINVFDVFEGEQIGKDKKSYSVSFLLQDNEQTLTDKQIDGTMQKLIATFEKDLGAIIRK